MNQASSQVTGAEVEWSISTNVAGTNRLSKDSFARGTFQLLDNSPNRTLISGKNYGPQIIHVFVDGAVNPPDISPGESFTIVGDHGRIMIRVL